ncbi:XdhC family protein [Flavobacterium nackdongense]|uniref:XdhC/CoxI family protein n=1 Tax=Flavobacterium nackdongense TaxID=2547394 RepID=A0A4P6YB15_9FLAO|nr:XdhC/CoxI family protein [Flavobacterium nackdongense]QBN17837.1 XdhC/CoxI family protein [Flavobacterium nackdongense]
MTFEFKNCIHSFKKAQKKGIKTVMATLVALEGSSYRKPGVRMLLCEDGKHTGAISGGCVEKEIQKQAESVFQTNQPKMMTYDGRYRLGCEGTLYILIETFHPEEALLQAFENAVAGRKPLQIKTYYERQLGNSDHWGSQISFDTNKWFALANTSQAESKARTTALVLEQQLQPCFRLIIVGAEHDAVHLCLLASVLGWEVVLVASALSTKTPLDFPGVHQLLKLEPNEVQQQAFDEQTAIVLMTHSYARDLQYLLAIKDCQAAYIGLLGAKARGQKLINELVEQQPELEEAFLEKIHSPAGLDIGSITPQEIALSICSEILSESRKREAGSGKQEVRRGREPTTINNKP